MTNQIIKYFENKIKAKKEYIKITEESIKEDEDFIKQLKQKESKQ